MIRPVSLAPVTFILVAALLSGCATHPDPDSASALAKAEIHLKHAREADARQLAELELHHAEQVLVNAYSAAEKNQHIRARQLAESAAVDARYAALTAETRALRTTMKKIRKNLRLLEQELNDKPS